MQDYKTPEGKVLSRDLTAVLNTAIRSLASERGTVISVWARNGRELYYIAAAPESMLT